MIGRLVEWHEMRQRGTIRGLDGKDYEVIGHYLPRNLKRPALGTWLRFDPADPHWHRLYRKTGAVSIKRAGIRDMIRWTLGGK